MEFKSRQGCILGNVIRVLGVGQDITERIDNEGQLLAERFELIERNKELTCLYGISQVVENSLASFNETLEAIVELIPRRFDIRKQPQPE